MRFSLALAIALAIVDIPYQKGPNMPPSLHSADFGPEFRDGNTSGPFWIVSSLRDQP